MQPRTRKALKNMARAFLWMVVLTGFVILVASAAKVKDTVRCSGIVVKIKGSDDNFFIEEKDIRALVARNKDLNPVGRPVHTINIAHLEKIVSRDPWVKQANLFIDNQHRLNIKVTQREPVARVFTVTGSSFYLDAHHGRVPVSERYTARVPVFTGFPTDALRLQRADSLLTAGIVSISSYVLNDPFWMAQVEQVNINGRRQFEIIPKLGDHIIDFGDGTQVEKKFRKLLAFYQEGLSRVGWNNYSRINVAFENEVVCTRKEGTPPPKPTPPEIDSADVDLALAAGETGPDRSKSQTTTQRQPKAVYRPDRFRQPARPANKVNTTQKHRTP